MKTRSVDEWIKFSAAQKRKLSEKQEALREKEEQVALLSKQVRSQLRKLNKQEKLRQELDERFLRTTARLRLSRKELKVKAATIRGLEETLELRLVKNKHLALELDEKNKIVDRLNRNIVEGNKAAPVPEPMSRRNNQMQRFVEAMETRTARAHELQGGAAGSLG